MPSSAGSSTGAAAFPSTRELARLEAKDAELRDSIAALTAQNSDLRREQAKAEADVEQVRARIDRDRQRLDSGMVSSPRELENLQSEVAVAAAQAVRPRGGRARRDGAAGDRAGQPEAGHRRARAARNRAGGRHRRQGRGPGRAGRAVGQGWRPPDRGRRHRSPPTCSTCTTSSGCSTAESARPRCGTAAARAATSR